MLNVIGKCDGTLTGVTAEKSEKIMGILGFSPYAYNLRAGLDLRIWKGKWHDPRTLS